MPVVRDGATGLTVTEKIATIVGCGNDWRRVQFVIERAIASGRFTSRQVARLLELIAIAPQTQTLTPKAPARPS